MESLPLDLPVILYNGAMLYDPIAKRPLWTAEIPPEAHIAAEKAAKRFSASAGMEVLTPEGLYAVRVTPMIEEHLGGLQKVPYRKASFAELGQKRWLKVMIALPEEEMDASRACALSAPNGIILKCCPLWLRRERRSPPSAPGAA